MKWLRLKKIKNDWNATTSGVLRCIGGFGIASDFAWQLQAYFGYRISRISQLSIGYRAIGTDYQKGSGSNRFLYDVTTFGPVFRFGFNLR